MNDTERGEEPATWEVHSIALNYIGTSNTLSDMEMKEYLQ